MTYLDWLKSSVSVNAYYSLLLNDYMYIVAVILDSLNPELHMYAFYLDQCRSRSDSTSVSSDLNYNVCLLVRNNLMNLRANSLDPDQLAQMCRLIWIYTGEQCRSRADSTQPTDLNQQLLHTHIKTCTYGAKS
jgi:hypothetical protein